MELDKQAWLSQNNLIQPSVQNERVELENVQRKSYLGKAYRKLHKESQPWGHVSPWPS